MKRLFIGIVATFLVVGIITLVFQRQTEARLRDEIGRLRRENSALDRLGRENRRLAESQVPHEELERLRNDQGDLQQMRAAYATLKTRMRVQTLGRAVHEPPKPLASGMTPVESLANAGTATPDAAARSFFWAVAQIDPDAMAKQLVFSADSRAKADTLFASLDEATRKVLGTPERMMATFFVEMYGRTTGLQVLGCDLNPSSDTAWWKAKIQTATGRLHDVDFPVQRSIDGWHVVILPYWIDGWSQYLH